MLRGNCRVLFARCPNPWQDGKGQAGKFLGKCYHMRLLLNPPLVIPRQGHWGLYWWEKIPRFIARTSAAHSWDLTMGQVSIRNTWCLFFFLALKDLGMASDTWCLSQSLWNIREFSIISPGLEFPQFSPQNCETQETPFRAFAAGRMFSKIHKPQPRIHCSFLV